MSILNKSINRIRTRGLVDTVGLLCHITIGVINHYVNPFAKKQSKLPPPDHEKIRRDFESKGLTVIPYKIDISNFKNWLKEADFPIKYIAFLWRAIY